MEEGKFCWNFTILNTLMVLPVFSGILVSENSQFFYCSSMIFSLKHGASQNIYMYCLKKLLLMDPRKKENCLCFTCHGFITQKSLVFDGENI